MKDGQTYIGTWFLHSSQVDVYVIRDTGGAYFLSPEPKRLPRIKVGILQDNWWEVRACAAHEVIEMLLCLHGCRLHRDGSYADNSDGGVFLCDHAQFSDIVNNASAFMDRCEPALRKVWRKERT